MLEVNRVLLNTEQRRIHVILSRRSAAKDLKMRETRRSPGANAVIYAS